MLFAESFRAQMNAKLAVWFISPHRQHRKWFSEYFVDNYKKEVLTKARLPKCHTPGPDQKAEGNYIPMGTPTIHPSLQTRAAPVP